MRHGLKAGIAASVVALTCASWSPASADEPASPLKPAEHFARFAPRIVNGTLTSSYPTTGALLNSNDFNTASMICSGTLIGCQTFLTAAHCVCDTVGADCQGANAPNPAAYSVFLQHAGLFTVSNIVVHPSFDFPVGDVAVITLTTPVTGIVPTPINAIAAPPFGTAGTIVGFGRSGGGAANADYGIKRAGSVATVSCSGGVSSSTSVCWDFNNPLGPAGSNSNTCNGDSGGSLFLDLGAGPTIGGITSGGTSDTCFPTDNSYDANVFFYHSWIQTQAGADLNNTSCGTIPQVGQPGAFVFAAAGTLSSGAPEGRHSVQVPSGSLQLRVAMNAIDDGGSDFDLYVKFGSPPTTTDFDCRRAGTNQYGFCEFDTPAPGTWHVLIERAAGAGMYQVTTTRFGIDCADQANAGQPCDDGNACTANDVCQGGFCAGAPITDGTPCDDDNLCTQPDTCQAGTCVGGQVPRNGCLQPFIPQKGLLDLQVHAVPQSNKASWSWTRGAATTKENFGDPVHFTDYALCLYDEHGGTPALIMQDFIPAGGRCGTRACWKSTRKGFIYSDRKLRHGNTTGIVLQRGGDGFAKILIKGKGVGLGVPTLPLQQDSTVRMQLTNGNLCWSATYSGNIKNTAAEFKAKPD